MDKRVFGDYIRVDKEDIEKGKKLLVEQASLLFKSIVENEVEEFVKVNEEDGGFILSWEFSLEYPGKEGVKCSKEKETQ